MNICFFLTFVFYSILFAVSLKGHAGVNEMPPCFDENKGSFIYMEGQKPVSGCYIKLSPARLKRALPSSYVEDKTRNYLVANFIDHVDYLGQVSLAEIKNMMSKQQIMSLKRSDADILKAFPSLTKKDLSGIRAFIGSQLNDVPASDDEPQKSARQSNHGFLLVAGAAGILTGYVIFRKQSGRAKR